MKISQRYEMLAAQKEAYDKMHEALITTRLNNHRLVAKAVLRKSFGPQWEKEDLCFLGPIRLLLLSTHASFIQLTENHVKLLSPELRTQSPQGLIELPRAYLSLSDRAFAKKVRTLVKERKAYKLTVKRQFAAQDIQALEKEIALKQEKIASLRKMLT